LPILFALLFLSPARCFLISRRFHLLSLAGPSAAGAEQLGRTIAFVLDVEETLELLVLGTFATGAVSSFCVEAGCWENKSAGEDTAGGVSTSG